MSEKSELPTEERHIELELSQEKKTECKNIVKTINEFGVSQRQKLFLIQLLSLELENREVMKSVSEACSIGQTKLGSDKSIISEPVKKRILLKD